MYLRNLSAFAVERSRLADLDALTDAETSRHATVFGLVL
jgi:hypothetical protein